MSEILNDRLVRLADLTDNEAATMDELCQRVADGESLTEICKAWDVPRSRIAAWVGSSPAREASYHAAQALHADALMSEVVGIADGASEDVQRDRLSVDTRMKVASKLYRARFGDSMQHTGKGDAPLAIQVIERTIIDPKDSV